MPPSSWVSMVENLLAISSVTMEYRRGSEEFSANVKSISQLTLFVLLAAFVSALPPFFCLNLKMPIGFVLTALAQGFVLGICLRWIFRTVKLRDRRLALCVAIMSATLAVIFMHVGFYLQSVLSVYRIMFPAASSSRPGSFLFSLTRPFRVYNLMVQFTVGHGGLFGYSIFRLRNSTYSTSTIVHAFITPYLTWKTSKLQLSTAFCESCAVWMGKPQNAAVLPVGMRDALIDTVKSGDIKKALEITHAAVGLPLGNSCVVARYSRCPTCGAMMADVVARGYGRRNASKIVALLPVAVTQEFIDALRSDPVVVIENDRNLPIEPETSDSIESAPTF